VALNCRIGSGGLNAEGESVRRAQNRPRLEVFVFRPKVELVDFPVKVPGSFQCAFHECRSR
jgi:hypothetical protein